ncbi:TonB-dependent receptor [Nonlabens agnitus]|uniref:TonB-dependent receptor n=1 Tax=Nonlabens agnitus TaxID=870484 RepID=A0A2S9WVL3_9FLAO|nr:carboxypeptidase regulatory-like domain-containing protein [Nonlabens agnitus]PRP67509.1 TonB-dependent receptor [Nonlabens agnitus]
MNKSLQIFLFLGIILSSMASMGQGVTTSSINGRVLEGEDQPLLGATIVAVHTPTGTKYGSVTDIEGYYRINNMRVGGPYDITITYVGKQDLALNNIFLQLGESEQINATLAESTNALDEIVIQAQRNGIFDSGKTGPETNISTREINTLPTTTRNISDLLRKTPQADVSEGGAITLAGQNNRYNSFYIDGTVQNDAFGLSGTGTNGGQVGVNPISLDAIESFSVNLAPFDVRQSGFAGGTINAITRSGTNEWSGSAYGYYRNEDLAGKTPGGFDLDEREKLDEFTATLIGARIGGPIIENKLFFFLNYERQDEETPRFFNFDDYQGNASLADIQALRQGLIDTYGYNPGTFGNSTETLTSDKFTIRLDYNLDDKNTFTLKHNYVNAENSSPSLSSPRSINFSNAGVFFPSETNSSTLEWRTTNGSNLSNNLVIGYTTVNDNRDPLGNPFPRVSIGDGPGGINLGSEAFSTGNILEQEVFTVTNNFEIQSGAHNITVGANFENFDVRNVFVRENFGSYNFSSLADFTTYLDGIPGNEANARFYDYSYSLLDPIGTSGDNIQAAAAAFNYSQIGVYAQDAWNLTNNFRLTYGVRFDVPFFSDGTVNEDFNNNAVTVLEAAGKDLQGARVGKPIKSQIHVAPRLGFNWDVNGDNSTQIRGGLGVFTSRIPLVWPGGTYNNNGISVGGVDERNFPGGVQFLADPANQPIGNGAAPGSGQLGGQIDLFAPDFKLPQVLKYNIGVDQEIGIWGLIASADFLYNDVLSNVQYENINIAEPIGTLNGADNRPFYSRNRIVGDYTAIYLGTNTDKGYSYNATFTLTKPVQNGFGASASYTYGDGKELFDNTSSQNSSQWRNLVTVNGKNQASLTNSQFATGHRITASATYELNWNENIRTQFGLFYTGQNGARISYIYDQENTLLLGDDSRDNASIYVPANASEINLVPLVSNGQIFTPADQYAALDAFIENDEYLRSRRGQYAERNGSRASWNHSIDLKVLQDFSIYTGANKDKRNTLQLSVDIFNVANLINKDWGEITQVPNFNEVELIRTESGGPNPTFTFDPSINNNNVEQIDDFGTRSSRWQMQIGARYIFN